MGNWGRSDPQKKVGNQKMAQPPNRFWKISEKKLQKSEERKPGEMGKN